MLEQPLPYIVCLADVNPFLAIRNAVYAGCGGRMRANGHARERMGCRKSSFQLFSPQTLFSGVGADQILSPVYHAREVAILLGPAESAQGYIGPLRSTRMEEEH